MTDLNHFDFAGHITKDSVVEKTKEGISFVRFSVAMNRSFKKKGTAEYENKVTFVDMTIFGSYAESMVKYLTKGTYLTGQGYLDMSTWVDANGQKQQRLRIVPIPGTLNPWIQKKTNEGTEEISIPEVAVENGEEEWPDPDDPGAIH